MSDLQVQCQMVEKKAVERRQAEEKVILLFYIDSLVDHDQWILRDNSIYRLMLKKLII